MPITPERDKQLARQGRLVSIVIAVAITLWLISNWVVTTYNIPIEYALLFDFAALGAMVWAFIVAIRMRRERRAK